MKKSEIILFETKDKEVTLSVPMDGDTVWLTQAQMAELFNTTKQNVSLHANNCFKEGELDMNAVVKDFLTTASDGKKYKTKHYNLDVIISVGYRVKSKRGIEFRQWASKILKQYMIDGYAINEKRLNALQKTVDIQTRMMADALNVEEKDILKAVNLYIEDHPLADGCKRIAASLFLEFLERNKALFKDGSKRIGDGELVAITLMIAESNPDEKDIMVKLVMNLLDMK